MCCLEYLWLASSTQTIREVCESWNFTSAFGIWTPPVTNSSADVFRRHIFMLKICRQIIYVNINIKLWVQTSSATYTRPTQPFTILGSTNSKLQLPSPWVCPSVRLSVCPSVTFVSCAKTNKDIFEIFSPSASQAIPVFFLYQTVCRYSDGNPPNGGVECKGVW